MLEMTVKHNYN